MLSIPSVSDLASFKGKSENFYSSYAEQALMQAALLLSIRTGLTAMPEDESEATLARYAIMDLANKIYLEAPYDEILAKPFSSESIGSYSYSKSAQAARKGDDSGSMWFELALERLGNVDGDFEVNSGSISMFERSNIYQDAEGRSYVLGPDEVPNPDVNDYFYINAEKRD